MAKPIDCQDAGCCQGDCEGQADPGADSADIEDGEEEQIAYQDAAGVKNVLRPQAAEYDGPIDALVDVIDTGSHIVGFYSLFPSDNRAGTKFWRGLKSKECF